MNALKSLFVDSNRLIVWDDSMVIGTGIAKKGTAVTIKKPKVVHYKASAGTLHDVKVQPELDVIVVLHKNGTVLLQRLSDPSVRVVVHPRDAKVSSFGVTVEAVWIAYDNGIVVLINPSEMSAKSKILSCDCIMLPKNLIPKFYTGISTLDTTSDPVSFLSMNEEALYEFLAIRKNVVFKVLAKGTPLLLPLSPVGFQPPEPCQSGNSFVVASALSIPGMNVKAAQMNRTPSAPDIVSIYDYKNLGIVDLSTLTLLAQVENCFIFSHARDSVRFIFERGGAMQSEKYIVSRRTFSDTYGMKPLDLESGNYLCTVGPDIYVFDAKTFRFTSIDSIQEKRGVSHTQQTLVATFKDLVRKPFKAQEAVILLREMLNAGVDRKTVENLILDLAMHFHGYDSVESLLELAKVLRAFESTFKSAKRIKVALKLYLRRCVEISPTKAVRFPIRFDLFLEFLKRPQECKEIPAMSRFLLNQNSDRVGTVKTLQLSSDAVVLLYRHRFYEIFPALKQISVEYKELESYISIPPGKFLITEPFALCVETIEATVKIGKALGVDEPAFSAIHRFKKYGLLPEMLHLPASTEKVFRRVFASLNGRWKFSDFTGEKFEISVRRLYGFAIFVRQIDIKTGNRIRASVARASGLGAEWVKDNQAPIYIYLVAFFYTFYKTTENFEEYDDIIQKILKNFPIVLKKAPQSVLVECWRGFLADFVLSNSLSKDALLSRIVSLYLRVIGKEDIVAQTVAALTIPAAELDGGNFKELTGRVLKVPDDIDLVSVWESSVRSVEDGHRAMTAVIQVLGMRPSVKKFLLHLVDDDPAFPRNFTEIFFDLVEMMGGDFSLDREMFLAVVERIREMTINYLHGSGRFKTEELYVLLTTDELDYLNSIINSERKRGGEIDVSLGTRMPELRLLEHFINTKGLDAETLRELENLRSIIRNLL